MTRFVLLSTMNFSRMRAISHCLSPCITDQWNANFPSYVSIRLIWKSSLVVTENIDLNLLARVNASLCNMRRENGSCFVDNSNISADNLFKDKLHLLDSGKTILAKITFIV